MELNFPLYLQILSVHIMSSSNTIFIVILFRSNRGDALNKCFITIILLEQFKKKRQHSWKINGHELSCEYAYLWMVSLSPSKFLKYFTSVKKELCWKNITILNKFQQGHIPTKIMKAEFSVERHIWTFCNT